MNPYICKQLLRHYFLGCLTATAKEQFIEKGGEMEFERLTDKESVEWLQNIASGEYRLSYSLHTGLCLYAN